MATLQSTSMGSGRDLHVTVQQRWRHKRKERVRVEAPGLKSRCQVAATTTCRGPPATPACPAAAAAAVAAAVAASAAAAGHAALNTDRRECGPEPCESRRPCELVWWEGEILTSTFHH